MTRSCPRPGRQGRPLALRAPRLARCRESAARRHTVRRGGEIGRGKSISFNAKGRDSGRNAPKPQLVDRAGKTPPCLTRSPVRSGAQTAAGVRSALLGEEEGIHVFPEPLRSRHEIMPIGGHVPDGVPDDVPDGVPAVTGFRRRILVKHVTPRRTATPRRAWLARQWRQAGAVLRT